MFDWKNHFDKNWFDFANLVIQSFHNLDSASLNNTTTIADPTILMPMQNGAAATCHKPDMQFVCVLSSINFAPHIIIAKTGPTILRTQYYIQLPRTTIQLLNRAGINYNLTTWHGTTNLSALSREDVRQLILDVCLQDGSIALLQADFNLGKANIDSNMLVEKIHAKILKLGFR